MVPILVVDTRVPRSDPSPGLKDLEIGGSRVPESGRKVVKVLEETNRFRGSESNSRDPELRYVSEIGEPDGGHVPSHPASEDGRPYSVPDGGVPEA